MTNSARGDFRAAIGVTRRRAERYPAPGISLSTVWLDGGETLSDNGALLDISADGFAARMNEAPMKGHLVHARLGLGELDPKLLRPIEIDARVCAATPQCSASGVWNGWLLHLAVESIHPVEEKLMQQAIKLLKDRPAPAPYQD